MRLEIELIPKTTWGNNVRSAVSHAEWDRIRKKIYQRDGYHCRICGDGRRLHCHEQWDYYEAEDPEGINLQRLTYLITLCDMCHHIKHIGRAELLCHQGKLDKQKLIAHFCKINECDEEIFYLHRYNSYNAWARRSLIEDWEVEYEEQLRGILEKC